MTKLLDGTPAAKMGELQLTCHDVQEPQAALWTFDPPSITRGPGKHLPQPNFQWYPLMLGDEEVGLAHNILKIYYPF